MQGSIDPPQQEMQKLVGLYNRGKLEEVLEQADVLILRYPHAVVPHNIAGAANAGLRRWAEAVASFDKAIRLKPDYAEAYNNRGNALRELKRLDEALASYDRAIQLKPDSVPAHNNRGNALRGLNRLDEALASYDRAIQLKPDYADAHNNRGYALQELKRLGEALTSYDRAIQLNPDFAVAYNNHGIALQGLKRLDEALASYDRAIQLKPDSVPAHNNRGNALRGLNRLDEALASYDRAIQLKPDYADAHNNRGCTLQELKRLDEALASHNRATQLEPDYAEAYNNRGNALRGLNRLNEALASYDKAIQLKPDYVEAYSNRGVALQERRRLDEALASYGRAIQLKPDYAEAHSNRGIALQELGRSDEAIASYDRAIRLKPDYAEAYNNRGYALQGLKRLDEALASHDRAVRLRPDYAAALSQMAYVQLQICDWTEKREAFDIRTIGIVGDAVPPSSMLALEDNPESHLKRAQNWSQAKDARAPTVVSSSPSERGKLKIGYFSADFHNHATMYLMAGLFEHHDRSKFEIHAFSYGVDAQDEMRQRLLNAVDEFHETRHLSDQAVAELSRENSVDIAVDLKGYTENGRSGIFAYRAAPIQINYLGYPGSMGADFIDYIVADRVLIPDRAQRFYSEKIAYLPDSYQVNDRSREISTKQFERSELALPDDGFVFCCFNNSYKISSAEFDIWMRLLAAVEGSVLWLLRDNKWAEANMRKEAEVCGIDANRLVFADRMALPDHLARHRCADLFLDTFNVNAHTTASDALWAGLPIITKLGEGFAARVAASLLNAIRMPELVTETPAAYEQLALDLATNPDRLRDVKAKLAASRMTMPLFDTQQFTRQIEQAYETAHRRYTDGLPPDHIEC